MQLLDERALVARHDIRVLGVHQLDLRQERRELPSRGSHVVSQDSQCIGMLVEDYAAAERVSVGREVARKHVLGVVAVQLCGVFVGDA